MKRGKNVISYFVSASIAFFLFFVVFLYMFCICILNPLESDEEMEMTLELVSLCIYIFFLLLSVTDSGAHLLISKAYLTSILGKRSASDAEQTKTSENRESLL